LEHAQKRTVSQTSPENGRYGKTGVHQTEIVLVSLKLLTHFVDTIFSKIQRFLCRVGSGVLVSHVARDNINSSRWGILTEENYDGKPVEDINR
jgi:hypothetical protein